VVFALLAAILHLCNIEMAVEPESDELMVMNEEEIDFGKAFIISFSISHYKYLIIIFKAR